ncbi:MAG TPA: phage/plasmid primase, P4 family, partial [Bacillota bacterium]|nr:phage/plasmid primase, P4 family [Bacillota bacterium]
GLCAIDLDADEDLATFLALNPKLTGTLRTRGSRGGMVWVRIEGEYPASCSPAHKHFEWRADRRLSTIYGRHPKGMDYTFVVKARPVTLRFEEIVWPEGWDLPWKLSPFELLERELGPALHLPEKGPAKINQGFVVEKLLREHDLLFDDQANRFYRYSAETGVWSHVSEVKVQRLFAEEFRSLIAELKQVNDNDKRLDALYFGLSHNLLRSLTDILKGAAAKTGVFQKPNRVVHAANGMVDLTERPFAFRPFAKEFYSRNQSPIAYDPKAKCPRLLNELLAPAMDQEDMELLQNWCGLALLGRNIPQVMLILSGTAGGGKGTIVNIIHGILGERNVHQLRTEHLDSRFETSFYHDKMLLCGADVEPNFLNTPAAHHLKALTGNDLMTTEHKGSSVAQLLRGDFNVLVTCNSRLMVKLQGDAEAWARRLLWIEFNRPKVAKIIHGFDALLLREEGPGILNWMLEGAVRLLAVMDAHEPFPQTAAQRERVNNLLSESDAARSFILSGVERSAFPLDAITSEELFAAYLTFCDERGWSALSQRAFEMKAKDLMVQIHRACPSKHVRREGMAADQRGYQGVVLKSAELVGCGEEGDNEPF